MIERNADLIERFAACEEAKSADAWDALGMDYFNRGFVLNAGVCFRKADELRTAVQIPLWDAGGEWSASYQHDCGMIAILTGTVEPKNGGFEASLGDGWLVRYGKSQKEAIESVLMAYEASFETVAEVV